MTDQRQPSEAACDKLARDLWDMDYCNAPWHRDDYWDRCGAELDEDEKMERRAVARNLLLNVYAIDRPREVSKQLSEALEALERIKVAPYDKDPRFIATCVLARLRKEQER
jgi:hypothetical protein